jgi:hypothetical protein
MCPLVATVSARSSWGPELDWPPLPAERLFGPLQPARTRIVLDYHGPLANRAGPLADIAARHHVTASTVSYNTAAVRAAGIKQPLSSLVVIEAERDSTRMMITWAGSGSRPPSA